ncbi:hypothetical protein EPI10_000558 [Gossypium australe]|uniref:Uncharacterized protein n=1 Tax=Gossypium australe TaxID=47621 RepID=A0A5B6V887_9ROSI|nr:hypothetical protein EPI10_000558 [Gossypium australe]
MDNKEIKFCEGVKEEGSICASESTKVSKVNNPVVIISRPKNNEAGNYNCNVTILGKEKSASASKEDQDVDFYTRSGRCYDLINA